MGKESIAFIVEPTKNGQLVLKDPDSLIAFREGSLKATLGERAAECMTFLISW